MRMPARRLHEVAPPAEKAFLVAVDTGEDPGWTAAESLVELQNLAATAGADVVGGEWQNRRHVDPEDHQRLEDYLRMARDLGANVVTLNDKNVSDALVRFAQQENISPVVFGQAVRSRWDILLRGSVLNRFLRDVRDVTVQVVPMEKPLRR